MSGLAQIFHHQKKKISGSDSVPSEITKSLKLSGIKIFNEHKSSNIKTSCQLLIYSQAISEENEEIVQAKKLKIPTMSYPQALGELTKDYYTIAIAGTHGKSTTTAMTALIAIKGGLDPTVVIGTKLKELKNQNYRVGKSNYLIIEACEYKRSFLHFHPNVLIITNIEAEHLDYYKNLNDYKKAFKELIKKVPKDGTIIINEDEKNLKDCIKEAKSLILKYSQKRKTNYLLLNNKLIGKDGSETKIDPTVPGEFNRKNASSAAIAGILLNIDNKTIENSIKSYKGSWRRMQYKKTKYKNVQFIDDYGHHPTEIRLTMQAIREKYPDSKILCIFQPHQYSRTHTLLKDFAISFKDCDTLIIPNIYKVRDSEKDLKKISTDTLVAEIAKHHSTVKNGNGLEKTSEFIKKNYKKFDVIVTMGAGDISKIYKLI